MGVGHPRSFFLYVGETQISYCSYGLFYQVDREEHTKKYHNNEHLEIFQKKHTSQV